MQEEENDIQKQPTEKRTYVIPQGYSWYGISVGHFLYGKPTQKRSLGINLLYSIITIVGVILILLIL